MEKDTKEADKGKYTKHPPMDAGGRNQEKEKQTRSQTNSQTDTNAERVVLKGSNAFCYSAINLKKAFSITEKLEIGL